MTDTAIVAVACFVCAKQMKLTVPRDHVDGPPTELAEGEPPPMHQAEVYEGDDPAEAFTLGLCPECESAAMLASLMGIPLDAMVLPDEELRKIMEEGQASVQRHD